MCRVSIQLCCRGGDSASCHGFGRVKISTRPNPDRIKCGGNSHRRSRIPSQLLAWTAETLPSPTPPNWVVGNWAWVHNTAANTRQGVKIGTDAKALTPRLSLNWTGLYNNFVVDPCSSGDTPVGSPLGAKLLHIGYTLGHARRGCTPPSLRAALVALCQPP